MDTNHTDNFIDDGIHSLDQSTPPDHVSWRDLPDWQGGLGELLTRILERSRSTAQHSAAQRSTAQQGVPSTDDNSTSTSYTATAIDQVARSPGLHEYPLWKVRCRVS
jgi:hypothetical protein